MSKSKNFAIGAVIAAAAGYVAGILTAPKSGRETRQDIKDGAEQTITEVEKKLKSAHTELHKLLESSRVQLDSVKGKAKTELDSANSFAEQAKEIVRVAISSIHEGESSDKDLQKALSEAEKSIAHLKKFIIKK